MHTCMVVSSVLIFPHVSIHLSLSLKSSRNASTRALGILYHLHSSPLHTTTTAYPILSYPTIHIPSCVLFRHNLLHLLLGLTRGLPDLALQQRLFPAHVEVVDVAVPLDQLGGEVDGVAAEQEVVCRADGEGVAHEGAGVEGQGAGHAAGDTVGLC